MKKNVILSVNSDIFDLFLEAISLKYGTKERKMSIFLQEAGIYYAKKVLRDNGQEHNDNIDKQ